MLKKSEIFILMYFCILLFCSVKPYEQQIVLPAETVMRIYEIEQERCLVPPMRNVPERYKAMFADASLSAGIPPGVLEAIADVESNFKPWAQSPARNDGHSDQGMFQFNNKYHKWYSDNYNDGVLFDPFNPHEAIRIAALHIKFLYERYGHWPDVFMAYNAGMGRVDKNIIPDSAYVYLSRIYRSTLCE